MALTYAHRARDALKHLDEAIKLDPNFERAYHNRGGAYHRLGQYSRAAEDYTQAIRLKPMSITFYARARCYLEQGMYGQAIDDYTQAIQLNPQYVDAYHNRAACYRHEGDYDRAWADVRTVRELGGTLMPELLRQLRRDSGRTD